MFFVSTLVIATSFLSLCGPKVNPTTTRAIIAVESGGNPYAIGDNYLRRSFAPRDKAEAVKLASYLLSRGHNIDLGLMQINSTHLSSMRLSLEDVFDPCRNIHAGTTILADFYEHNRTEDKALSLFKAISAYNTGQAWRGPGYVNKVLQAAGVSYRVSVKPLPSGAAVKLSPVLSDDSPQFKADSAASAVFFSGSSGLVFPVGRTGGEQTVGVYGVRPEGEKAR